jgi:hypothetical protein
MTTNNWNFATRKDLFGAIILMLLYLGTMSWFHYADIWHTKFNTPGLHYLVYNIIRFLFLIFLILILCGIGAFSRLILINKTTLFSLSPKESFVLDFFLGAAVCLILMYLAGIMGWYYRLPILLLTAASIFFYYPYISNLIKHHSSRVSKSLLVNAALLLPAIALVLILAELIIYSGLSVGNFGIDSAHYLSYYQQVIDNHGTAPNELWYHFWMTKGAGLHFLAVLLLDIQSPQLVSTVFLIMTAFLLFTFAKRFGRYGNFLGLLAALLYSSVFLATSITNIYHQKLHLITAGLVAAIAWMLVMTLRQPLKSRRSWLTLVSIVTAGAVLQVPPLAPILGLSLGVLWMIEIGNYFFTGLQKNKMTIWPALTVSSCFLGILLINFAWTGMAEVTPFRLFFNYANQFKLSESVSPYIILLLAGWTSKSIGAINAANVLNFHINWQELLYVNALPTLLQKMLPTLICLSAISMIFSSVRKKYLEPFFFIAIMMAISLLLSQMTSQPESIHRFYVFNYPLLLMIIVVLISALLNGLHSLPVTLKKSVIVISVSIISIVFTFSGTAQVQKQFMNNAGTLAAMPPSSPGFLVGKYSFQNVITNSNYNMSPSCTDMAQTAQQLSIKSGGATRPNIWTLPMLMEVGCYILPTARVMMEISYGFGNKWEKIVFGTVSEAKTELKAIDISFFYIDLAEGDIKFDRIINSSLMGCLAYSPLFKPQTLRANFRVAWSNKDKYLLVLDEKSGTPLPDEFINKWSRKIAKEEQPGLGKMKEICHHMQKFYFKYGEKWPVPTNV